MDASRITRIFEVIIVMLSYTLFFMITLTKASPPVLSTPSPGNGESNISAGDISLKITINDEDNDSMNITFQTNASGTWNDIGTNNSVPNGTYAQIFYFIQSGYTYYWSVHCSDGTTSVSQTYYFTTRTVQIVSIDINQSSYAFGTQSLNSVCYTNETQPDYFGITNNGDIAVDLQISATDMTCSYGHRWTLSTSNGPNQYVLDCSIDGSTWDHITLTETTFYTNLSVNESIVLNLRLTMPSSISCGHVMGCTIRISATPC